MLYLVWGITLLHLCLKLVDLDSASTQIRKKGWEFTDKILSCDNGWQAWVTASLSLQIELMQHTKGSSQITGNLDWWSKSETQK